MTQSSDAMPTADSGNPSSPEREGQYHHYRGNDIPWYVRLIWIGFWIFAVAYTVNYLFPDLQRELLTPP